MTEDQTAPRVISLRAGHRRGRQSILLDDGRSFVYSDEACLSAGVRVGAVADEAYLQQLDIAEQRTSAHESAIRLLSYRARSEREVRSRLAQRGIGADIIAEELQRLRAAGLLDDEAFAKMWVQERVQLAPRGERLLRNELRAKGISADSIDVATGDVDDHATALSLARTRARKLSSASYDEFRRKVGGLLRRKGFDYVVTSSVLREVWAESGGESAGTGQDAAE